MYKGLFILLLLGGTVYFVADEMAGNQKLSQLLAELKPERWNDFRSDFLFVISLIGGVMISDMVFGDQVTVVLLILILLGMLLGNSGKITDMLRRIGSA